MNQNNKTRMTRWRTSTGMTVIELLIILAAVAIVVMISVPGSTMVLEHYRLKSTSSDLVGGLNLAKGEALKRNSTVRVCPSSNGRFCRTDGNWNHGWLVYSDGNADGTVQEIEFIEAFQAPGENVWIVASGAVESVASFTLAGLVPENDYQSGEFHICHKGAESRAKSITIDQDGWVEASPIQKASSVCKRS